jgi:hypothetical protein
MCNPDRHSLTGTHKTNALRLVLLIPPSLPPFVGGLQPVPQTPTPYTLHPTPPDLAWLAVLLETCPPLLFAALPPQRSHARDVCLLLLRDCLDLVAPPV